MNEMKSELPFKDYLALDRYGSSSLRAMRKGPPAMVKWQKEHPEETSATRIGSAAHSLILTPTLFERTYAFKPEGMSFATKEGKAWRDAHEGREILTFDEAEAVRGIFKAFSAKNAAFSSYVDAEGIEATVLWDCGVSGLRSKGRPDWYTASHVYELKISRFAQNAESIPFRAYMEGWMHQLAHNRAGLNACGVSADGGRIVVISPKQPHGILVHLLEVKLDALDLLELENIETRKKIMQCDQSGIWPGTPDSWQLVEPPNGAFFDTAKVLDQIEVTND